MKYAQKYIQKLKPKMITDKVYKVLHTMVVIAILLQNLKYHYKTLIQNVIKN